MIFTPDDWLVRIMCICDDGAGASVIILKHKRRFSRGLQTGLTSYVEMSYRVW